MQVAQYQPPQHHMYHQYHQYHQYQPPQYHQYQQPPNKTQNNDPSLISFKHIDTVCVPQRPTHTQPYTKPHDESDIVTNLKYMYLSNREGSGNGSGNNRKRVREPLQKLKNPRKRKRPCTRKLVENDEQYELYLAKLRKKHPISGLKNIFLKHVYRRYKFYKTGFEKWKELMQ